MRRVGLVIATLVALAAAPASAQALTLRVDKRETGWFRFQIEGTPHAYVQLYEGGLGAPPFAQVTLGDDGRAVLRHGAAWTCTGFKRAFAAKATNADGSTETDSQFVDTPSCAHRLSLNTRVTGHRSHRRVRVRVADRWRTGEVDAGLCRFAPGKTPTCPAVHIGAGKTNVRYTFRARPGLWTFALETDWRQRARRSFYVRPTHRLRLLATGDSMIEYVDLHLKRRLGRRGFKVRSDARISTGISKPFLLDWPRLASRQARSFRQDVTVVFIGANDGFPFGSTDCCGEEWVKAYAKRVLSMMQSYSRRGSGLVYWLTLPAPRPAQWRAVYPAVNRAIKRAAALQGFTRVIDIAKVFTPGGRFRVQMTWHGRRVTVRQGDGVHLSAEGASIAESLIQRALRRDGVIG